MSLQLIGLTGYAGSGKDTAAAYLVERHGYRRVAFADKLKELALALPGYLDAGGRQLFTEVVRYGGMDVAKREEPAVREYLQNVGVVVRDVLGEDTWVDAAFADVNPLADKVVITDVRFDNEVFAVWKRGGKVLRIDRPGTGPVNDHVSERPVDHDLVVSNAGTVEDLHAGIDRALGVFPGLA